MAKVINRMIGAFDRNAIILHISKTLDSLKSFDSNAITRCDFIDLIVNCRKL